MTTDHTLEEITTCAYVGCAPEFVDVFNSYFKLLRRCGYDFDAYATVDHFLEGLSKKDYDFVLTEAGMPARDELVRDILFAESAIGEWMQGGYQLLNDLRTGGLNRDTPVVFLTGWDNDKAESAYRTQTNHSLAEANAHLMDLRINLPFQFVEMLQEQFPWLDPQKVESPDIVQVKSVAFVYANNIVSSMIQVYQKELEKCAALPTGKNDLIAVDEFIEDSTADSGKKLESFLQGKRYDLIIVDSSLTYKRDQSQPFGFEKRLVSEGMKLTFELYDRLNERSTNSPECRTPQLWMIGNTKADKSLIEAAFVERYGKTMAELGIKPPYLYFKNSIVDRLVRLQEDFRTFPTSHLHGRELGLLRG